MAKRHAPIVQYRPMDLARPPHTLLLPIDPSLWPPPVEGVRVDGVQFMPKTELHLTLIGSRLGRELHTTLAPAFLRDRVERALLEQDWHFVRSGRFLQLATAAESAHPASAEPGMRRAIIELVELPAMRPFHQALGRLLGRQLSLPPPHVTLYTAGDRRGIGVTSPRRLRAWQVRELRPERLMDLP